MGSNLALNIADKGFQAETPYTLMFGPDKCGDTHKVHFILRHRSPVTGEWEEKHLVTPPVPPIADRLTHLYTAIVGTDNSVRILIDGEERKAASLLSAEDFDPPVNPPLTIDDPEDLKPSDWVDEPQMDDPAASKPADWDEDAPPMIPDASAVMPEGWLEDEPPLITDPSAEVPSDWDEDEDGDWEAPVVPNPKCKEAPGCGEWSRPVTSNPAYQGKWVPPRIDNPAYKGPWKPRRIDNPAFFNDSQPHAMAPIGGIGIELWTMQEGILFDNILISADDSKLPSGGVGFLLAENTFVKRQAAERQAKQKRPALVRKPGLAGAFEFHVVTAFRWIEDHMLAFVGVLLLGLIPLIWFCCLSGSDADPPSPAQDRAAAARALAAAADQGDDGDSDGEGADDDGDDGSDDEEEEAVVEELPAPAPAEVKRSSPARKRTPKAS